MAGDGKGERIAIITVHGTGDNTRDGANPKWWEENSAFSKRLQERLAAQGIESDVTAHIWSGANSDSERETGSEELSKLIKKTAAKAGPVHIIGHSHGGNVANDAADFLGWGRTRRAHPRIASMTTVGTPFFNSKTGWAQTGAGLLFLALTWGSIVVFPLAVIFGVVGIYFAYKSQESLELTKLGLDPAQALEQGLPGHAVWSLQVQNAINIGILLLFVALVFFSIRFMFRMSTRGVRRVMRVKRKRDTPASVFSIYHPNDEAISFLQKVEIAPIEAFPKGSMYRGSRSPAVGFGVLVVVGLSIVGVTLSLATGAAALLILPFLLLAVPLVFAICYLIYRYVIGNLLEWFARGALNKRIAGIFRGIAYGKDGDQMLCEVSTSSHTIPTREHKIEGELAERMHKNAEASADKLIERYRWSLFSIGTDANASFTALTKDAMTWDSLIHTTYFDQPELAVLIADHIASVAKSQA